MEILRPFYLHVLWPTAIPSAATRAIRTELSPPKAVPGSYTLLAIEEGWDLDWSRPGVIAPYLKRGRPVEIQRETSSPVKIEQAVELQSK